MNLITFSAGQVQNLNFPTPALDKLLSYTYDTHPHQSTKPPPQPVQYQQEKTSISTDRCNTTLTNNTFSAQLLAPLTHHTSTTLHHKLASKLTKRE
jgi:hypothetical protein